MSRRNAFRNLRVCLAIIGCSVIGVTSFGQTPVITVRFANPQHDCVTQEYCLDVEFKSDIPDQEVFGMNVRFFYDDQLLELIDFRDFQGGYGAVAPDPPIIFTSEPAGPALFNFIGAAEFFNGAIQLVSNDAPIFLDTENYTKLFQICFDIDGPIPNLDTFCPPVVWDLEQDPANGGFLSGDDGVVITIVDPDPDNESYASNENVDQFNWEYIGNGPPPFGQPIEVVCTNINCALPVSLLYFKGYHEHSRNFLEWKTAQEINLLGYDLQRSHDKTSWKNIGFFDAMAEQNEIAQYHFIDDYPLPGNNYYRLLQRDLDGNFQYSHIINIPGFPESESGLLVWPNPVKGERLTVEISQFPETGMIFQLLDSTGNLVWENSLESPISELDIPALPSGLYLAVVSSGVKTQVRKLVIH